MTYEEISNTYALPVSKLQRRVHKLQIKGRIKNRHVTFTADQITDIVGDRPPDKSKKFHPRKIKIVEFWLKGARSGNKVAYILNLHRNIVNHAIREYETTGCCIVESKMNKPSSI